jgi:hypothetical protein
MAPSAQKVLSPRNHPHPGESHPLQTRSVVEYHKREFSAFQVMTDTCPALLETADGKLLLKYHEDDLNSNSDGAGMWCRGSNRFEILISLANTLSLP